MFKRELHEMCDGRGLTEFHKVPQASAWISDGTSMMTGANFVAAVNLRLNTLYNRSRATRGWDQPHTCSRGCECPETLNHILQQCYSTNSQRIKRHDNLVKYLGRSASQRGYTTHIEPRFDTTQGVLKPDLVLYNAGSTTVVDVQVINDQYPLSRAHSNKIEKYKPLDAVLRGLRGDLRFTSLTINWRGAMCKESIEDLVKWGVITKRDIKTLAVRTLEGGAATWRGYQKMTCRRSRLEKKGEG